MTDKSRRLFDTARALTTVAAMCDDHLILLRQLTLGFKPTSSADHGQQADRQATVPPLA